MIKFTILLRRNPSLTHEEFVAYHKDAHARLFMSVPVVQRHVRRYVQQHALEVTLPGLPPGKYDGVTELWFDDMDGLGAVFGDAEYLERVRPDEAYLLDLHGCDFIVSTENTVAG